MIQWWFKNDLNRLQESFEDGQAVSFPAGLHVLPESLLEILLEYHTANKKNPFSWKKVCWLLIHRCDKFTLSRDWKYQNDIMVIALNMTMWSTAFSQEILCYPQEIKKTPWRMVIDHWWKHEFMTSIMLKEYF